MFLEKILKKSGYVFGSLALAGCAILGLGTDKKDVKPKQPYPTNAVNDTIVIAKKAFGTINSNLIETKIKAMIDQAKKDETKWPEAFAAISLIENNKSKYGFQDVVIPLNKTIDAYIQNYAQTKLKNAPEQKVMDTLTDLLYYSNLKARLDLTTFKGNETMKPVMEYVALGDRLNKINVWVKRNKNNKLEKVIIDLYATGKDKKGLGLMTFKDKSGVQVVDKITYFKDSEKDKLTRGLEQVNSQSMTVAGSKGYTLKGKLIESAGGRAIKIKTGLGSQEIEKILQKDYNIFTEPGDKVELFQDKDNNPYAKVYKTIVKLNQNLISQANLEIALKNKNYGKLLKLYQGEAGKNKENKVKIEQFVRAYVNINPRQEIPYGTGETFTRPSTKKTGFRGWNLETNEKPLISPYLADVYKTTEKENPEQVIPYMLNVLQSNKDGNGHSKDWLKNTVKTSQSKAELMKKLGKTPEKTAKALYPDLVKNRELLLR